MKVDWGATLTVDEPVAQFDVSDEEKVLADQKLIIKQIMLGADAVDGEFNVVEAETQNVDGEIIKIPIAVLKAGETRSLKPNIEFPASSVQFKLVKGIGPVYIHGQHIVNDTEGEEDYMYDKDDVEECEEEELECGFKAPRAPNANGKKANSHKKK
ncbi:nucleoplasmin-like protein isoform X2 [Hermetia illucens]|uniref:nucleoplasmin-like protein isoform X2 n=1 Tax=Hermetia illucens TaxID=343691 RepID=UPI0018CC5E49|nr:nucleoplasmin-like protein isoform X2 [Hermetia illucens]